MLHLLHALLLPEGQAPGGIPLPVCLQGVPVFIEVFDLATQVPGVVGTKQGTFIHGEEPGGAALGVTDHRHQPGGDGFHAGDGLDLHEGGMDIEIGTVQRLDQLLAGEETAFAGHFLPASQPLQRPLQGAVAGQDKLYVVPVLRSCHGADQHRLGLLGTVSAGADDGEFFPGLSLRRGAEKGVADAVGDHIGRHLAASVLIEKLANEVRGVVNGVALAEHGAIKVLIHQVVHQGAVHGPDVSGEVFRLAMEAGGDGLVQLPCQLHGAPCQSEGHLKMHDVRLFDDGSQHGFVGLSEDHAVFLYGTVDERSKAHGGGHEIVRDARFRPIW